MAKAKTKSKKAAPVVDEDEDVELEELEEDDEEEAAPKSKRKGGDDVTFGAADLAKHLSKVTGKSITPKALRMQLRRMARDGRLDREIVPGNKARYDWPEGLNDPEVKQIIKAVKAGEIDEAKKEALDNLKTRKAAQDAKAGTKKKRRAPEPEELDDEDEDEDE